MQRHRIFLSVIALFLFAPPLWALPDHVPGEVLVRFKPQTSLQAVQRVVPEAATIRALPHGNHKIILKKGQSVERALERLNRRDDVIFAQPNYIKRIQMIPDDPFFEEQWGLQNTGQVLQYLAGGVSGLAGADSRAPAAWDVTTGAANVRVAVIDTGVEYLHPDLKNNIWSNPGEVAGNGINDDGNTSSYDYGAGPVNYDFIDDVRGWDFVGNDNQPLDETLDNAQRGHGTQVAGVIAAQGYDGFGVAGVSWQASIMILRAFDMTGESNSEKIEAAVDYAIANGARIINASFGGEGVAVDLGLNVPNFDRIEYEAFRRARDAGILVVAAACNFGYSNDNPPATRLPCVPASYGFDNIVSVAASGMQDTLISASNYGPVAVDLAAPGEYILTTDDLALGTPRITASFASPPLTYTTGTSIATAFVSGAAALLLADNPALSATQLRDKLLGSARQVPTLTDKVASGGVLNIAAALGYDPASRATQGGNSQSSGAPGSGGGGAVSFPLAVFLLFFLSVTCARLIKTRKYLQN